MVKLYKVINIENKYADVKAEREKRDGNVLAKENMVRI